MFLFHSSKKKQQASISIVQKRFPNNLTEKITYRKRFNTK